MLTLKSNLLHPNLTVQPPNWDHLLDDPTASMLSALSRYLPSNTPHAVHVDEDSDGYDIPVDAFPCDNFRMYEFKVRMCARARSHDWTECPFAHPGEKARRRDPRQHRYTGIPCPEFRKGTCRSGDSCEYAHGVFECWLHPSRYRTQPCKDGTHCRRRVCFFAHTPDQIRITDSTVTDSPPMSPLGSNSASELATQMGKMRMSLSMSPPSPAWGVGYFSPGSTPTKAVTRPGFLSLPSTPTNAVARPGPGNGGFDIWEESFEEEPVMERVESGRNLRAKIYAKLGQENSLNMSWI